MVHIKANMQMSELNALRLPGVCNRSTDAYGNEAFQEEDKWQLFVWPEDKLAAYTGQVNY